MSNNEYEIEQDLPDHNWRTELPNIIFEMGLDCFSISLYAAIKKIAGIRVVVLLPYQVYVIWLV